jgi:hypothetical protein
MSPRGSDRKGTELLVEHVWALEEHADRRPPFVRLSDEVGERLASILVAALTGDHAMRVRELVA